MGAVEQVTINLPHIPGSPSKPCHWLGPIVPCTVYAHGWQNRALPSATARLAAGATEDMSNLIVPYSLAPGAFSYRTAGTGVWKGP